jgi:murein tripeptide amidase MpaA
VDEEVKMLEFGMRYESVMIDNVERCIEENGRPSKNQAASWFDNYHPFSEIVAFYQNLTKENPLTATYIASIGSTVEGRDIPAVMLGSLTASKKIFIQGGQHAREWISHTTVAYIAQQLVDQYNEENRLVRDLMDNMLFIIVPVVNVDGYVYTWETDRLWRKNRRKNADGSYGVDLNRNWDVDWGGEGSSRVPSSNTYIGESPFSEPETRAVADLFFEYSPIDGAIDYHSYSQYVLRPYGYTSQPPPNHQILKLVGEGIRDNIRVATGVQYTSMASWEFRKATGSAEDWFFSQGDDILSYSIELRDTGTHGYLLPPDQILATGKENFEAFKFYASFILKNKQ